MKARLLAKLHGRKVYAFPVHIECGENAALLQDIDGYEKGWLEIISTSPAEAYVWCCRHLNVRQHACVTVEIHGVRGGIALRRSWGWDTAIAERMWSQRPDSGQLLLTLKFRSAVERLSSAFCEVLEHHLSRANIERAIELNRAEKNADVCHTHDFCDANMTMLEAWEWCFNRDFDANNDKDLEVWNAAWDLAKKCEFNVLALR